MKTKKINPILFMLTTMILSSCGFFDQEKENPQDSQVQTDEKKQPQDEKTKESHVGLSNLGNTCFMNAALQVLFHTKSLLKVFDHFKNNPGSYNKKASKENIEFFTALHQTFIQYQKTANNTSFEPLEISAATKKILGLNRNCEQEDAHEFLNQTINKVIQVLPESLYKDFHQDIHVQTKEKLNYSNANPDSIKLKEENPILELSLGEQEDPDKTLYLDELVKNYFATEQFTDDQDVSIRKEKEIIKTANFLSLKLIREKFNLADSSDDYKSTAISYPQTLFLPSQKNPSQKLQLQAIICKSGNAQKGHYWSYVKLANKWHLFNDSQVKEVSEEEALKQEELIVMAFYQG